MNLTIPSSLHHTRKTIRRKSTRSQAPVAGVGTREEGCRPFNIMALGEEAESQTAVQHGDTKAHMLITATVPATLPNPLQVIPLHPISPTDLLGKEEQRPRKHGKPQGRGCLQEVA